MIERTDITALEVSRQNNKLGISDPRHLARAEADLTARRLAELRIAPIPGGFDTVHLQAIHRHVYQDLYDWAGKLRETNISATHPLDVAPSLDAILDRLAHENHLKGRSAEDWSQSASGYILEIAAVRPFLDGNELALREFADELARRNNLSLQWPKASEGNMRSLSDRMDELRQSSALRRAVMLAMDTGPCPPSTGRGKASGREVERLLPTEDLLP